MLKRSLSDLRSLYHPNIPSILSHFEKGIPQIIKKNNWPKTIEPEIATLFPMTQNADFFVFDKLKDKTKRLPLKVGVLFSGGQAPGGHNVVSGLYDALKEMHADSSLIGFLNGPSGLIENKFILLDEEKIKPFRNQGGFHLLGSGRTKIETEEQFDKSGKTLQLNELDGLIIIGGDDSNTNAAFLAEYCAKEKIKTRIVGAPKTIDGDLKNEWIETSFGFDTASKIYSEFIGNVAIDALSAKKYYFFIKVMGRSASNLTLECGMQTQVNLTLIGEECAERGITLKELAGEIAQVIIERAKRGKEYGIILVPEGLLEFLVDCKKLLKELNQCSSEQGKELSREVALKKLSKESLNCFETFPEAIQSQLFFEKDPHGNIQLAKIETERLLISLVEKELSHQKGISFNPQPLFCGYEGRSGLPSNFDSNYCYALGRSAALFIQHSLSGYIVSIRNLAKEQKKWEIHAIPILQMLHFEERKGEQRAVIKKGMVDLESPLFAFFKKNREKWKNEDHYLISGPIQFEGPKEITEKITLTLDLTQNFTNIEEQ